MRKGFLLLATVGLLLAAAVGPAQAASPRGPIVGIGDQKTQMFEDPRFRWLGIRHARLVVPWYVASGAEPAELRYVDAWMRAARRAGVQPLVGFGHGFSGFMRIYLPKTSEYRRAVQQFRRRYPWVKSYITWNEANHCSQPTCRRPERVGQYFDALSRVCRRCTIVSTSVIDQPNMTRWLRRFDRASKRRIRIVGLHNYLDVNRLRSTGTRRLLRAVPKARIWVTETGGIVRRKRFRSRSKATFPENPVHAGLVTRYTLQLARRLPRIERLYLYHWNVDRDDATWDSGLIDPVGRSRPGFTELARFFGRDAAQAPLPPAPPAPEPVPPPPGMGDQPPPDQQNAPSSSPPPPEPEPEPDCTLASLCIPSLDGR